MIGLVINFVLIIFFAYMAFSIIKATMSSSNIFTEFEQSKSFAWFSLLFPLGPILYLVTLYRLGWLIAILLMLACYLPALITSKMRANTFERAGTDRVNNAQNSAMKAFGTAIVGVVYTTVLIVANIMSNLSA